MVMASIVHDTQTWRGSRNDLVVVHDTVPEFFFRALAQKTEFKILESKDDPSIIRRDMAFVDSTILS